MPQDEKPRIEELQEELAFWETYREVYRGKGIDAMLYHWIWTTSARFGITWGEAGWILEDNPAMNASLEKMNFTVYKTYRLYDRPA